MSSVKIYGIMVIYNKLLKDSLTYQSIKNQDIELVVCDNSNDVEMYQKRNQEFASDNNIHFLSMEGNKGLSYAYNRGLEYIFAELSQNLADRICLLDDDTQIPDNYILELQKKENIKKEVLLPIVRDELGIMSPVRLKKGIATRIKSVQELDSIDNKVLSGINSAMAIKAEIYQKYRYDEEMFLDYIDHKFIMDMRELGIYPQVLNIEIKQNFSAVVDSKDAARRRFRMQKKDLKIFYRKQPLRYWYIVVKKHMKLVLKYKDITMMFC